MIAPILGLGFLLGVRHALEADHIAAVATLATRSTRRRDAIRVAGAWGIGHAAVLLVVGSALIAVGVTLPSSIAKALEATVGLMLIGLGLDTLRRLLGWKRGADHSHSEEGPSRGLLPRALFVGSVHGMEGSGALVLAALPALHSPARAIVYLLVFGLGSIAGMIGCSLAVAVPLGMSIRPFARFGRALQLALGGVTVALGCWVLMGAIRS